MKTALNTPFNVAQYTTPTQNVGLFSRLFPSLSFYPALLSVFMDAGLRAKKGCYSGQDWGMDSLLVLQHLERVGCRLHIEGLEHFRALETPCIFAGNHMSSLETMCLASMIQPFMDVTFVIKQSLFKYPLFKHILKMRQPISLKRIDPREDLKKVLDEGAEKLAAGTSIIVFPQSTRYQCFDPIKFNSIAVKLAKKAQVPIIPLALKTDAWTEGALVSDFGRIIPSRDVYFSFGKPLFVSGNGKEAQAETISFIVEHLHAWGVPVVHMPNA